MKINPSILKKVTTGLGIGSALYLTYSSISEIIENHKLKNELLTAKAESIYKDTVITEKEKLIKYYEELIKESLNK